MKPLSGLTTYLIDDEKGLAVPEFARTAVVDETGTVHFSSIFLGFEHQSSGILEAYDRGVSIVQANGCLYLPESFLAEKAPAVAPTLARISRALLAERRRSAH